MIKKKRWTKIKTKKKEIKFNCNKMINKSYKKINHKKIKNNNSKF